MCFLVGRVETSGVAGRGRLGRRAGRSCFASGLGFAYAVAVVRCLPGTGATARVARSGPFRAVSRHRRGPGDRFAKLPISFSSKTSSVAVVARPTARRADSVCIPHAITWFPPRVGALAVPHDEAGSACVDRRRPRPGLELRFSSHARRFCRGRSSLLRTRRKRRAAPPELHLRALPASSSSSLRVCAFPCASLVRRLCAEWKRRS